MTQAEKERVIRALKFVKVAVTPDGHLTDISVAMLVVEIERREANALLLTNGERQ